MHFFETNGLPYTNKFGMQLGRVVINLETRRGNKFYRKAITFLIAVKYRGWGMQYFFPKYNAIPKLHDLAYLQPEVHHYQTPKTYNPKPSFSQVSTIVSWTTGSLITRVHNTKNRGSVQLSI